MKQNSLIWRERVIFFPLFFLECSENGYPLLLCQVVTHKRFIHIGILHKYIALEAFCLGDMLFLLQCSPTCLVVIMKRIIERTGLGTFPHSKALCCWLIRLPFCANFNWRGSRMRVSGFICVCYGRALCGDERHFFPICFKSCSLFFAFLWEDKFLGFELGCHLLLSLLIYCVVCDFICVCLLRERYSIDLRICA